MKTMGAFNDRKVFFLKDGRIGMEHGGRVIVTSMKLGCHGMECHDQP